MANRARPSTIPSLVFTSRDLRKTATLAEQHLWSSLRGRALAGWKFRRQYPLGRWILDFYCQEACLAVEVDGSIHQDPEQSVLDQERTAFLAEYGIRVVRFTNEEVLENREQVLEQIAAFLKEHPMRGG